VDVNWPIVANEIRDREASAASAVGGAPEGTVWGRELDGKEKSGSGEDDDFASHRRRMSRADDRIDARALGSEFDARDAAALEREGRAEALDLGRMTSQRPVWSAGRRT